MKTTLNIDDKIMRQLKQEAAREGKTMSALLEAALRTMLHGRRRSAPLPPLPRFRGGVPTVNVANREALYERMEGR